MDNDTSQSTDDYEMPSASKTFKKYKSKRPSRKLELSWSDIEESSLISAVKKQRSLWDCSVPEYKLPLVKLDCWQVVAHELDMVENWEEARKKWNSMRSNFKSILRKLRTAGQEVDCVKNVKYPHFNEMLFIDSIEAEQSSQSTSTLEAEQSSRQSTSTLDMDKNKTDGSNLDPLSAETKNGEDNESMPIKIHPAAAHRRKRIGTPVIKTPQLMLSPLSVKKIAAEVLANIPNSTQRDRFTAIGEVFACHLRNLDATDAVNLELRLFKVLHDFLGSRAVKRKNI